MVTGQLARKCYKDSLKLKKKAQADEPIKGGHLKVNLVNIEPTHREYNNIQNMVSKKMKI